MNEIFYSPAGRRGLDVAGLPSRKQSMNPCEQLQSPLVRKPFSPLPTTMVASKANIATPQQLLPTPKSNAVNEISAFATPVKNNNSVRNLEEEKLMMMQTPKNVAAMIPIPSTPATISVPMQTAATPFNNARLLPEKVEVVEYSFEERRLAFMLQSESLIHMDQRTVKFDEKQLIKRFVSIDPIANPEDRSHIDSRTTPNGKDKSCKNRDIVADNWIGYSQSG
ncbi:unnamed protein product [Brassica oleracea]